MFATLLPPLLQVVLHLFHRATPPAAILGGNIARPPVAHHRTALLSGPPRTPAAILGGNIARPPVAHQRRFTLLKLC